MKTLLLVAGVVVSVGLLLAQEKPVPKDSTRIYVPGCAKGSVFTVGERTEDQPGRSDLRPGSHLRMNGPKKVMGEIKAHQGTQIEIIGLIRKSQDASGINIGGVRVSPGLSPMGSNQSRDSNMTQTMIDVEEWRALAGTCPTR